MDYEDKENCLLLGSNLWSRQMEKTCDFNAGDPITSSAVMNCT